MAKQTINVGNTANDRTGDPLRIAFSKTNSNFTEVYTSIDSLETAIENIEVVGGTELPHLELTERVSLGSPVTFAKVVGVDEQDEIDDGLTLARDSTEVPGNGGIYNSEAEELWDSVTSPVGLLWNWDGWDNLDDVTQRQYVNFRQALKNRIGENVVGAELVAHDTINDKYYTFLFTQWSQGAQHDGLFAYTRRLIDVSESIGVTFADGSNQVTAATRFSRYPQTYVGDTSAYTLVLDDAGKHVYAFGVTVTLPNHTTVDYPIGSVIKIVAENQPVTLAVAAGVTIRSATSISTDDEWLIPSHAIATLIKTRQGNGSRDDIWRLSIPQNNPVKPYIELTDTPFITQPAVLGEPVAVTAEPWSDDARFTVVIGEGPTIDSITITTAGTGYVVGQQYRIWSYYIGGPNDDSSIDFAVATVGANGELLTITDAAFVGVAENTPGTYTDAAPQYLPSVFDEIDVGLVLTRGRNQGIFNIAAETEYDNDSYASPIGTEWNSDGWGDLLQLDTRSYDTWRSALNNQVGNNILGAELVMHDTINDKYYKFEFTEWGGEDGGFAYTRTLVEDPNYFRKTDNGDEVDEISEGLHITRGNQGWLYNPLEDEGHDDNTPTGSLWNNDGWDNFSDIEDRTYVPLETIWGGNFNEIVGSRMVMKDTTTDKYWAIQFLGWTQGQNGGGFSYTRKELDLSKLNEGITFADGTIQKTAYTNNNLVSAAPGERRIETASGYKSVSVTGISEAFVQNGNTSARPDGAPFWDIFVDSESYPDIATALEEYGRYSNEGDGYWQVTINDVTYKNNVEVYISNQYFVIYTGGVFVAYNEGDSFTLSRIAGGESVTWWNKNELPSGGSNFRGAIIDYHAYTGEATWIGTIHIVDDDGDENITHTEVSSGSNDSENDDLWLVDNEGTIKYRRIDGEPKTLKIHWTAKVFYGSETYD
jgi:hypothetical protein